MTNHTLEKHNDWWQLHLPLVITKNLSKIPATPPKVDKYLPPLREREHPKHCAYWTTHNHREGPLTGLVRVGALPHRVVEWRPDSSLFWVECQQLATTIKPSTTLQPTTIATTSIFFPKIIKIHNSDNYWLETKSSKKKKKLLPNPPQTTTWN